MNNMKWSNGRQATMEVVLNHVGPGWDLLVQELIKELFDLGWDGQIFQIKEKFGGLRFYIGEGSDEVYEAIQAAEDYSYRVCEVTGKPGKLRRDLRWWRTLCDEEYNKAKEKQDSVQ